MSISWTAVKQDIKQFLEERGLKPSKTEFMGRIKRQTLSHLGRGYSIRKQQNQIIVAITPANEELINDLAKFVKNQKYQNWSMFKGLFHIELSEES